MALEVLFIPNFNAITSHYSLKKFVIQIFTPNIWTKNGYP